MSSINTQLKIFIKSKPPLKDATLLNNSAQEQSIINTNIKKLIGNKLAERRNKEKKRNYLSLTIISSPKLTKKLFSRMATRGIAFKYTKPNLVNSSIKNYFFPRITPNHHEAFNIKKRLLPNLVQFNNRTYIYNFITTGTEFKRNFRSISAQTFDSSISQLITSNKTSMKEKYGNNRRRIILKLSPIKRSHILLSNTKLGRNLLDSKQKNTSIQNTNIK